MFGRDGFQLKAKPQGSGSPVQAAKKLAAKDDSTTVTTIKDTTTISQQKMSFLSKFKKDGKVPLKESAKGEKLSLAFQPRSQSSLLELQVVKDHFSRLCA